MYGSSKLQFTTHTIVIIFTLEGTESETEIMSYTIDQALGVCNCSVSVK